MSVYIRYPAEGGGSGTVSSINGATGPAISILPGTGIDVTTVGNNITITNTGSTPTGDPNTFAGFDGAGNLETIPGIGIDPTTGGMNEQIENKPNNVGDAQTLNSLSLNINPLQDSPDDTRVNTDIRVNVDSSNTGFNSGNVSVLGLGVNQTQSGDASGLTVINMYNNIGNGTDPITFTGVGYSFAFGDINDNVTVSGQIQGYGFQPHVHSGAILDSSANLNAFSDFANIDTVSQGHTSYQSSPSIAGIANGRNFQGLSINPTIITLTGNANVGGVGVFGNITTMGASGNINGYVFSPTVTTSHGSISGLNVNPHVAGGDANFTGVQISPQGAASLPNVRGILVQLNGVGTTDLQGPISLETDSRISINAALTMASSQGFQIGNRMESLMQIPSGSPVTGTDVLGNNLAGDLLAQDNMALGPIGLGFNSVGFIASMAVAATKTVDKVTVFLPAASFPDPGFTTGGDITDMTFIKIYSPLSQGGTANISTLYGLKIDSLFGDFSSAASTVWGIYSDDLLLNHKLAGQLDLGNLELQGSTSGEVGIRAAATTTDYQLTLPPAVGSNGDVLTTNSSGVLSWAPGGSGANTSLSNLSSTSINDALIPDANGAYNLGDYGLRWNTAFLNNIRNDSGSYIINFLLHTLHDTSGAAILDFSTSGVLDVKNSNIENVNDPVSAQDAATKAYVDANAGAQQFVLFSDEKASGTDGGASTSGSWQTRDLNTTRNTQSWASLSSNQITLSSGTYLIESSSPFWNVGSCQSKFYDITNAADIPAVLGTTEYSQPATPTYARSVIQGVIVVSGSTVYELQSQTGGSAAQGFGIAANFGTEVYSKIKITKMA